MQPPEKRAPSWICSKMGKLFAEIADSGYIVEIYIVVFGETDQDVERDLGGSSLVVAVSPGRDLDRDSDIFLGQVILGSELLDSGFTCDTHRNDPFEKASGGCSEIKI
jgi:hypothetical protein